MDCSLPASSVQEEAARILDWVANSLLWGILLTQGLNPDLLLCRQILHHLSHQGSPSALWNRAKNRGEEQVRREYSAC